MTWLKKIRRLSVILWVLRRELRVLRRYNPQSGGETGPTHFVQILISLGPTFIKLGQILSTRPDILPEQYIAALEQLQEQAPAVPLDVITATIEAALGGALTNHYATFDPHPVASASLRATSACSF